MIALFHGWQRKPTYKNAGKGIWDFVEWSKASWDAEAFQYHKSWDWIMPVVKKIDTICSERGSELSNKSMEQEHLENKLDNPKHWKNWSYHYVKIYTIDIDIVYNDVVEFIKWYNGYMAVTPKETK